MPGSINSDGSVYNASGVRVGQINSDGTVYNATYTNVGNIERDGTVRNSIGMIAGKVEDDGTVRDSGFITIGKVDDDGTVYDSNFLRVCQIYNAPSPFLPNKQDFHKEKSDCVWNFIVKRISTGLSQSFVSSVQNMMSTYTQPKNIKPVSLTELLDEKQPYEEIDRLQDEDLSELNDDDAMRSRIQGSLLGLAVGDALGAAVEFRPYSYMKSNRVTDMQGGGTWGLEAGKWTDDTSMALCLAASFIIKGGFNAYDQLVRYKWWYTKGYMSSTGKCFDIGQATRDAIRTFEKRQRQCAKNSGISLSDGSMDRLNQTQLSEIKFDVNCGDSKAAGNGPLMRLAPVPLFYHCSEVDAIQKAGFSATLTHGDKRASDACRFYSALIWKAIHGHSKDELLDPSSYQNKFSPPLDADVMRIVKGSYKEKKGYEDGIRGTGFILNSLEAALWAFYNDGCSFEKGALAAVNLGDDTDTTAAIYGQLAGAAYGIDKIPERWREQIFERKFIITLANGLFIHGKKLFSSPKRKSQFDIHSDNADQTKRRPKTPNESDC
ncbi:unnamed protein product [Adineta ricciae]|uniref:ADP-ribosylglycohydrolase n=1 Tax=Adineta ricciae TaxID=249248 RepID=A0A816AV55_ADIRI|nr:unnamed protein product [Adineta ricciae]CAF1602408.1 unnamed protein product [Adineta ricciae]